MTASLWKQKIDEVLKVAGFEDDLSRWCYMHPQEAAGRIRCLMTALAPFALEQMPDQRKSEIDFNEFGLRCAMSPMDIARRDARKAMRDQRMREVHAVLGPPKVPAPVFIITPAMAEAGRGVLYEFGVEMAVTADQETLVGLFSSLLTRMKAA